ncbi:MAG: MBL fold metallo-hydrolase [Tissierellia bacterium]|nr:MBL fold metallo-hydrolase [Tissierellia bacterium]
MIDSIKVTYVFHSCYTVEIGDYFLIFDYFKGSLNIPDNKKVVFIATHGHSDHYTSEILKIPNMKDYTYILSDDIGQLESEDNIIFLENKKFGMEDLKNLYNSKNVHFVKKDMIKDIVLNDKSKIKIRTFGSTDLGISILLNIEGISIFHAGDLNFWAWPNNDDETMKKEYDDFMVEIEKIKKYPIDISFFPVDYRLKENYYKGGEIFIKECAPQIFFPMHSGGKEEISSKFEKKCRNRNTAIRPIFQKNQKIIIDINHK